MVEGARLESVFRLTPNEGSNPSLSAINVKGLNALFCLYWVKRVRTRKEGSTNCEAIWSRNREAVSARKRKIFALSKYFNNPSLSATFKHR